MRSRVPENFILACIYVYVIAKYFAICIQADPVKTNHLE